MSSPSWNDFNVRDSGPVAVVHMTTETIRHPPHAQQFRDDLAALVEQYGRNQILVNMSEARYLGSSAFAALVGVARKLDASGGKMALCELHPDVMIGANILGLASVMSIYGTEQEALATF